MILIVSCVQLAVLYSNTGLNPARLTTQSSLVVEAKHIDSCVTNAYNVVIDNNELHKCLDDSLRPSGQDLDTCNEDKDSSEPHTNCSNEEARTRHTNYLLSW